jgi:hypothetical protein
MKIYQSLQKLLGATDRQNCDLKEIILKGGKRIEKISVGPRGYATLRPGNSGGQQIGLSSFSLLHLEDES